MKAYSDHYSVLKEEVLQELACENGVYADLTFGGGGHSLALAKLPDSLVLSFDQDPEALKNGRERILAENLTNIELVDSNFENFAVHAKSFLQKFNKNGFDGIVMDLGVSSHHFDSGERGFSFRTDAPLDMRMDLRKGQTAADLIAGLREEEISEILFEYGEEALAKKIAREIVSKRKTAPIETTFQLAELVKQCYPPAKRFGKINPATKTFQALRIAVNRELDVLSDTISQLSDHLSERGKIAVISFHSLEDRIVKNEFKNKAQLKDGPPFYETSKKPILPSPREIFENSRSRSAKMRVLEVVKAKKEKNKYAHLSTKEKKYGDDQEG